MRWRRPCSRRNVEADLGGDAATMAHRSRRVPSRVDRSPVWPTASRSPRPPRSRPRATSLRRRARDVRSRRRDEKVILEWNAMFASALLRGAETSTFTEAATSLLSALHRTHFRDGVWWRTDDRRAYASASDVAWLLDACVDAFEATGEDAWLGRAAGSRTTSSRTTGTATCRRRTPPTSAEGSSRQRPRHRSPRALQGDLRRRDALEPRRRVSRARAPGTVHR